MKLFLRFKFVLDEIMSMDNRLKAIYSWFINGTPKPYKVVMIPTNRCNLRCPYCPNSLDRIRGKFKKSDELLDKEWKEIVKEGLEMGVKEWSIIGGGEPFLRKSVVLNVVRMAKKVPNTDCEIITNGTLIKESDVKKLVRYGLDRILVSIDGPNAKIHDSLRRVKGAFEKATRSIRLISKYKKKLKREKPYIKVNMVLNRENYKEIIPMIEFLRSIGAQELALHPMREYYELPELKRFNLRKEDIKEMPKIIKKSKIIAQKYGILLNTDMVDIEMGKVTGVNSEEEKSKNDNERKIPIRKRKIIKKILKCSCFEPFYTIFIDPRGDVNACSPAGRGIPSLNVREKSLREIWNSKELQKIRELVSKGFQFEICQKCGLTDLKMHIRNALIDGVINEV
ncbi:MAG: radical SAM protein [Candidatus Aenigmarchaeota archaeon]|nr:radical SAM protein [Candidatus Aenigmarchaeota archaeon]